MSGNGHSSAQAASGVESTTIYCLVPADRPELRELLDSYLGDVPGVEVIADRRGHERRGEDRRAGGGPPPTGAERRQGERRSGRPADRRTDPTPVETPVPLPVEASGHAESVVFVEHRASSEDEEERLARTEAVAEKWRERCLESEREAGELARALVDAGEDLRKARKLSPRWLAAVKRAEQMIERYRRRRVITPDA